MARKLKVCNFFAGPSAGKTTNGLHVAAALKTMRKDVLYVPEFALEAAIDKNYQLLDDQIAIFGEQQRRLYRAINDFEWAVTDSPLFLTLHYAQSGMRSYDDHNSVRCRLGDLVMETFNQYQNYNFFVDRGNREFRQAGRIQNEEESKRKDQELLDLVDMLGFDYYRIKKHEDALDTLKSFNLL